MKHFLYISNYLPILKSFFVVSSFYNILKALQSGSTLGVPSSKGLCFRVLFYTSKVKYVSRWKWHFSY